MDFNRFSFLVPVLNQVKMIDFARFSYFVPVQKQVKKMEKKSKKKFSWPFIRVLKVNFWDQKLFKKTLFMHLRPRLNSLEKNLFPWFIRGTKYGVFRYVIKVARGMNFNVFQIQWHLVEILPMDQGCSTKNLKIFHQVLAKQERF